MDLGSSYIALIDALSAIREISEIELSNITEKRLVERVLVALVKHQDLENCSLFLVEESELVCVAGTALSEQLQATPPKIRTKFSDSMRFAIGEGLLGIACKTGTIQYCIDCSTDERFKPLKNLDLFIDIGSLISVPVRIGDSVQGVLNISHPERAFFETWHEHFLSLFVNCLGHSLHSHRLLHNMEVLVSDRTLELEQALSESEDLRQRYQRLSTTDELTGLNNRRYFFAEGESMLARAARYELPLSMLLMDVDYFKRINDNWGHATGDRVLRMIADVLVEQIRSGDLVARLGGEEFVLLLPNTGPVGADLMAKRVQERIGRLDLGGRMQELVITVSVGMTSFVTDNGESLANSLYHLYRQADTAMYVCKEQGRNRRLFYTPEMEVEGGE